MNRRRHSTHLRLRVAAAGVAAMVLLPVIGLAVLASQGSGPLWPHLLDYVLPAATIDTLLLLGGTGALAAVIGTATAYLVTSCEFPGRAFLERALLLPLAIPTYIVAYAYVDVLHPTGPVQTLLRALLGIPDPSGLRLPDIRSLGGCILLLGFVLYPYVYLNARAALLIRAADAIEAAGSLGARGWPLFVRVVLPLAWPAIAVGIGLVMMETLGDIGASEFLGVRTLTVAVYDTWVTRGSVAGAAQIALVTLAAVAALLTLERSVTLRRDRTEAGIGGHRPRRRRLSRRMGIAALLTASLPVAIGFAVPALHLGVAAALRVAEFGLPHALPLWLWNSARLAAPATLLTLAAGFLLAFTRRVGGGRMATASLRMASFGYALPGTVLAVGLLGPMAAFDTIFEAAPAWLTLSGSSAAVILAYMIRFLAIPAGALEASYARIPTAIDEVATGFGANSLALAKRIHAPLLTPALAAAALLVFIECMKELPATLLLRPLNVETLATYVYGEAARGTYEDGAVAALTIVLAGLLPLALLFRAGQTQRAAMRPQPQPAPAALA